MNRSFLIVALWVVVGSAQVHASVISLPPESFARFATGADVGQLFTAPTTDTRLDSFEMYGFAVGTGPVDFRGAIYEYNVLTNHVASGPLYTSEVRTAQKSPLQTFHFDTGGILLQPGGHYFAILQQMGLGNVNRNLQLSFSTTPYSGGEYRLSDSALRYSTTSGPAWANHNAGSDLALLATFSAPPPEPAHSPLPPALVPGALLAIGCFTSRFLRRGMKSDSSPAR